MTRILDSFLSHVDEKELTVLYAQVRQNGDIVDFWSRFTYGQDSSLTGFRGLSRFESYSTAKSFSAIGVGIAIDEKLISLDEKVVTSFPECAYDITNPYALDITVEDMLKMSSGLAEPMLFRDSPEREKVKDWPRYIYEKGNFAYKPGTRFLYSNTNTYMLGCLVERKYGKNLLEYMRYRLFEPLGIGNPDMTSCPAGHTVAANGLAINVDEMGRFGELILGKGVYKGKRIVSEEFIVAATSAQIQSDVKLYHSDKDACFDYGYQFWIDSENHVTCLRGILGQFCVIIPEKQAIVTVLSLEQNDTLLGKLLWDDVVRKL